MWPRGEPKLLNECTLPLTGRRVTDMVITDLGVFRVARAGPPQLTLIGLADGASIAEIKAMTEAPFDVDLTD